ncbi:MAG: hypothetical protein R2778_11650 [Saprospiraceae bacterium]
MAVPITPKITSAANGIQGKSGLINPSIFGKKLVKKASTPARDTVTVESTKAGIPANTA